MTKNQERLLRQTLEAHAAAIQEQGEVINAIIQSLVQLSRLCAPWYKRAWWWLQETMKRDN